MTRQFLFVVQCLLQATSLLAQDGIESPTQSRWQLGISAAPSYEYRTLKALDGDPVAAWITDNRNEGEVAKLGYSGGLDIRYRIANRLYVGAGVHYANHGYKTKPEDITDFDPLTGFGSVIGTSHTEHSFHYLEVPLSLDWNFYEQRRISLYVSGGITPGVLLLVMNRRHARYTNGSKDDDGSKDTQTPYNKISLSPTVAIGARYKFTSRSAICIAPTFRYGVVSVVDASIRGFLWSAGLNVGYCRDL